MSIIGFLDMGLGLTVNREISMLRSDNKISQIPNLVFTIERVFLIISILILIITISLSNIISNHWLTYETLDPSQVILSILIIAFILAFRWPTSLHYNILTGFQRFDLLNIVKIAYAISTGGGSIIILKYYENTLEAFLFWNLIINVIHLISLKAIIRSIIISINDVPYYFDRSLLKNIRTFSLSVAIYTLLAAGYPMANNFFLSGIFDLNKFGYYSLVFNLSLGITQIVYPISSAFFLVSLRPKKYHLNI